MNMRPSEIPADAADNVREISCEVPRTARYFLSNSEKQGEWVLAVHGYGQSARVFLEEVRPALAPGQGLIAPEGLSRFYQRGFEGEVVASWMTREDRLSEIKDHCRFLDQVVAELAIRNPGECLRVLAFSQGVATVTRWLARREEPVRQLILWTGTIPDDGTPAALKGKVNGSVHLIYGSSDPMLSPDKNRTVQGDLDRMEAPVLIHHFQGGHQLDQVLLTELLRY
jgi:predicted esterase